MSEYINVFACIACYLAFDLFVIIYIILLVCILSFCVITQFISFNGVHQVQCFLSICFHNFMLTLFLIISDISRAILILLSYCSLPSFDVTYV